MGKLSIYTRLGSILSTCTQKVTDFMLTTIYWRVVPHPLFRNRFRRRVVLFFQLFWDLAVPFIAIITVAIIIAYGVVWYFVVVIMETVEGIYLGL